MYVCKYTHTHIYIYIYLFKYVYIEWAQHVRKEEEGLYSSRGWEAIVACKGSAQGLQHHEPVRSKTQLQELPH